MKRSFSAILISIVLFTAIACGDDSRDEVVDPLAEEVVKDSIRIIEGEFIKLADDAVIKGSDFIYGVELDSLSRELAKQVEPLKSDEFEMIPVVVRGKILPNPSRDGWEEVIQIKEILELPQQKQDSTEPKVKTEIEKP